MLPATNAPQNSAETPPTCENKLEALSKWHCEQRVGSTVGYVLSFVNRGCYDKCSPPRTVNHFSWLL